ncbi:hypothetical protein KR093_004447, partial [Drosophila rubida]
MINSKETINSRPTRKIRIRKRSNWRQILDSAYPMPEAPPELCRDAFLDQLLKPYESETVSESVESEDSIISHKVIFTGVRPESFNAEEKLLNRQLFLERRSTATTGSSMFSSTHSTTTDAPDLNKLMRERYGNIAAAIGHIASIFNLIKLRDRMNVVREMWGMQLTIDKDVRMFGWSIKDYLSRFAEPNLVYLDTVERHLGSQIECFKFRMDLKEIHRLVGLLVDDMRNKRDICETTMGLIKDAETDIEQLLTHSQKVATADHAKVTKAAANLPRSADPFGRRAKAIHTKINHNDFVFPIEARYRINWAQTSLEQSILRVEEHENALAKELQRCRQQIVQVYDMWETCSVAFDMQIFILRNDILKWEIEYEDKLMRAEGEIQATRSRLGKAKDDLKYYRERIPMFHRKIEEVNILVMRQAIEEEP